MQHALEHAVAAAVIAPLVSRALAALLDLATRRQGYAVISHMSHRCLEGVLGGAIEGFLVSLVVVGIASK